MIQPQVKKLHNKILRCGRLVRDAFAVTPNQALNAYVLKTGTRRALLVSPEALHPHLFLVRTILSNYQGATADVVEVLASYGVDVREYDAASMGNVTLWNACLSFPENVNVFELRDRIENDLRQKCGMIPPISFFFIERFPFLGTIEKEKFDVTIDNNYDAPLTDYAIKNLGITWDSKQPSAVISTRLDLIPSLLFYFIPPQVPLVECELSMKDRIAGPSSSICEISRLVSKNVDLVGSTGITVRYGDQAVWRFYGILSGDLKALENDLINCSSLESLRTLKLIDPGKIDNNERV